MSLIRRAILAAALIAGVAPALAQVPPPIPALPDTERRTTYSITASLCSCNVNFQLYGDSTDVGNWIEVFVNGVKISQPGNWTLSTAATGGLANAARPITDAVLTFTAAQTGTVQIVGARRPRRASQFGSTFSARDINQVITDLTAQNRETWDKLNDATGRTVQAPPGETLAMLPVLSGRASMNACFDSGGNLTSCVAAAGSTTFAAGSGITFTGINPTTISTATFAAGNGIVFTGTNPTVISAGSSSNGSLFSPSRTAAALLDLHTYGVVSTGGYATAGDGGGATFKNVGSAAFKDTSILNGSITAPGSACANNTYLGVNLGGGTGTGATATIIVAGGLVTSVTLTGTKGQGYSVSDVLSATSVCAGFTWTISQISTPLASFADSVGTHFQYIVDQGNYVNVKQFGAKVDWTSTTGDAGATNDFNSIQAAWSFASIINGATTIDAGGGTGNKVIHPAGTSMVCGGTSTLLLPFGVSAEGVNIWASTIKMCDVGIDIGTHFITICDPTSHLACFGSKLLNLTLFSSATHTASANIAMVFSNNIQQIDILERVAIYAGQRSCFLYDTGWGGAAQVDLHNVECSLGSTATNPGFNFTNIGATIFRITASNAEAGGGGITANGIQIAGGYFLIETFHTEGISTGIFVNIPTTVVNGAVSVHGFTGGAHCTNGILRQAGSVANSVVVGMAWPNNCTNTVNNAGALTTTPVIGDTVY